MRKFFQFGFVFLCSAGAACAANLTIKAGANGSGCTTVNAVASGNTQGAISAHSAGGSSTGVNFHASGNTNANVAADSFGKGSSAISNVDLRTASGGRIAANSVNQSYYGSSVNELAAVATRSGVVEVDQVSSVKQGHGENRARGIAVAGNTKLVSTLIADHSEVDIDSRASAMGVGARVVQEVLADLHHGRAAGAAVGSATALHGSAISESVTVIQNGNVHSQSKTKANGCRSKATFQADFRVD